MVGEKPRGKSSNGGENCSLVGGVGHIPGKGDFYVGLVGCGVYSLGKKKKGREKRKRPIIKRGEAWAPRWGRGKKGGNCFFSSSEKKRHSDGVVTLGRGKISCRAPGLVVH